MKRIILKTPPISVNALYRGRRFLTKEGKSTKERMAWEAKSQFRGKPLKCDIALEIDLYLPNGRMDIDNVLKSLIDCLTGILWEDDKYIMELFVRKYIDKKNPRIEIEVSTI